MNNFQFIKFITKKRDREKVNIFKTCKISCTQDWALDTRWTVRLNTELHIKQYLYCLLDNFFILATTFVK